MALDGLRVMMIQPIRVMTSFDCLVSVSDDKFHRFESVKRSCPIRMIAGLPECNRFGHVPIRSGKHRLQMEFSNTVRAIAIRGQRLSNGR